MKRNLFAELVEGFDPSAGLRTEHVTLRSHKVEINLPRTFTAGELVEISEYLRFFRPIFARCLRANARRLENWAKGTRKVSAQATALIHLVQKHPKTVGSLAALA